MTRDPIPHTSTGGLTPAEWDDVGAILEAALELVGDARARYLRDACGSRTHLRDELASLLAEVERGRRLSLEPTPDATGPSVALGTTIGHWRIQDLVARGGMGEVYRAARTDGEFTQLVALKVVRPGLVSPTFLRRSRIEREILARLTHENIVGILDAGTLADGRPFLVMPLVEGESITTYCERQALGLEARVRMIVEVAQTVQFAHSRLVVHRDLKPSNILVTADGSIRLLDFGIAKLLAADPDTPTDAELHSEIRLLTPEHAAPEQVRGDPVTTTTDVYALGVLLYQVLTGTRPHVAGDRPMVTFEREVLEVEPAAPSVAGKHQPWGRRLRGDLDRIIQMALRKEPDRRYPSAAAFAEDLERWMTGLPVRAEVDSFGYRARKFLVRNRTLVAAGSLVAMLLAAFAVTSAIQASRLERERNALAIQQATTHSVVGLLLGLFEKANPGRVPGGDTLRVEQLLAEVDPAIDTLAGQPLVQAEMWQTLGQIHSARGRHDQARRYHERALARLQTSASIDSQVLAKAMLNLGMEVGYLEGNAAAVPLMEAGLAMMRRHAPAGSAALLEAEVETATRRTADSTQRADLQRLIQQADSVQAPMQRAAALNQIAVNEFGRGGYRAAHAAFGEVLRILDSLLPRDHVNRLAVAGNLAATLTQLGELTTAEAAQREIVAIQLKATQVDSLHLGNQIQNLASTLAERGFLDEADSLLQVSINLTRGGLSAGSHTLHTAQFNRAQIHEARRRYPAALATLDSVIGARPAGRSPMQQVIYEGFRAQALMSMGRWRDARAVLDRIEGRYRALTKESVEAAAYLALWLGGSAMELGQASEALAHFDAGLARARTLFPETHRRVLALACGRGVALARLGRSAEAQTQLGAACPAYRANALAWRPVTDWAREVAPPGRE
ncbi:MAG: serine/threonine protein kinase [Gemmatimonadetes bacterium]|nr:serine/threonine protein kinase [Gemmatimonadota bacterium]